MVAGSLGRMRLWVLAGVIPAAVAACLSRGIARADDVAPASDAVEQNVTQGALRIVQKDGGIVECPLKHTDVQADIAGFVARMRVTQTFHNPTKEKVEAVYVLPLPR